VLISLKIDVDTLYVILYRVIQVGSVGLNSVLITFFVDEVEQGIYFIFLNLVAAQLLFELGLNQAVLQVASHISDRTSSAYRALQSWLDVTYKRIALKFYVIISLLGAAYLYLFTPLKYLHVIYFWLLIALFVALGLSMTYRYALIESELKVSLSYKGKLLPLLYSTLSVWILLFFDFGLVSIAVGYAIQSLSAIWWLRKNYPITNQAAKLNKENSLFISQVEGLKNKFALSYIGGYVGFNSVVPIVYALVSPADAGRVGLSLALFSAVTIVASSFVSAKNASMASLISARKFEELNMRFKKYLFLSMGVATFFVIAIFGLIGVLNGLGFDLISRLMDWPILLGIAFASFANIFIYAMAIYVRSHKFEPFVIVSVVTAIMILVFVIFGANHNANWSVLGYVVSVILISLPWTFLIFIRHYKFNIDR